MNEPEKLIPLHGGYRKLKSFQVAREGKAEGRRLKLKSEIGNHQSEITMATPAAHPRKWSSSSRTWRGPAWRNCDWIMKIFLRQRGLAQWPREDARRAALIAARPATADDVAAWVKEVHGQNGQHGRRGQGKLEPNSIQSTASTTSTYAEISANGVLALLAVACSLLDRQLASLEKAFLEEGGFTERLYRVRSARRN
jgi:four helix bundle suffix protein